MRFTFRVLIAIALVLTILLVVGRVFGAHYVVRLSTMLLPGLAAPGIIFFIWARRENKQRVFHTAEAALAGTLIAVAILAVYEMWTGAVSPL